MDAVIEFLWNIVLCLLLVCCVLYAFGIAIHGLTYVMRRLGMWKKDRRQEDDKR